MMMKPAGLIAIELEMARQVQDARASFDSAGPRAAEIAASLRRTGRAVLLGMGASHALNRMVEQFYRALGIDTVALPVSEQLCMPVAVTGKTVILASQSGESAEVVRWLETAREGEVFGITLDPNSTLARAVPSLIGLGGNELAFAATRSLTLCFALHLAVLAALGLDPAPALRRLGTDMPDLTAAIAAFGGVATIATSGRRMQGVAEAAALGLCELSRLPAFSLEGGQMRHGPMEVMSPALGVVLFRSDEPDGPLIAGLAAAARDAGAAVVMFDASGAAPVPDIVTVALPVASGMAAVFALLPVMQRFMVDFAATRVPDVGTPRRSFKITRTE